MSMALCLLVVSFLAGNTLAFCPLPFAYLILVLGASPAFHRIGSRFDISYGMYIYGWPTQQILVLAGVGAAVPLGIFAFFSLAVTAPLAWLSCAFIEGPAQGMARQMGARNRFNRHLTSL